MSENLKDMLIRHEGLRFYPYVDTVGKTTIGVGHNLDDKGISKSVAMVMLKEDIESAIEDSVKWLGVDGYYGLNNARKMVVVNMMFNMGLPTMSDFVKFKSALKSGDFDEAAKQMKDSTWYTQVGKRGMELETVMRTGELTR